MLLGKRPRPPIKRTTSMSGITLTADPPRDDDDDNNNNNSPLQSSQPSHPPAPQEDQLGQVPDHFIGYHQYYHTNIMSPRNNKARGGGGDQLFVETAHFLRTCGLCQRRLAPGKDIFMYRGDTAFCSLECREQQMKQDGRREKCKVVTASKNEEPHSSSSTTTSTTPTTKAASRKSETVAAA